jgi:hypothetical protein
MTEAAFDTPFCIVHQLALPGVYTATESLFQAVRWWRTATTGVCCLAGIGGSGKTAAADELLRRLGVLALRPGVAQAPVAARAWGGIRVHAGPGQRRETGP